MFFSLLSFSPAQNYSPDLNSLSDTTIYSHFHLELRGSVRHSKISDVEEIKPIDSALVTIYCEGYPNTSIWTNKKGKCIFTLPLDKVYKVEVSKKGFTTKSFTVITKVPFDKKAAYLFNFDIDLLEEINGLDVSILKKPIAKVTFDIFSDRFAYDIKYTNRINQDLKKMYKDYYLLKKVYVDTVKMVAPMKEKVTVH